MFSNKVTKTPLAKTYEFISQSYLRIIFKDFCNFICKSTALSNWLSMICFDCNFCLYFSYGFTLSEIHKELIT